MILQRMTDTLTPLICDFLLKGDREDVRHCRNSYSIETGSDLVG